MIKHLIRIEYGIVYGFGIYMLVKRGFSSAMAGICLSLTNGFSLLIQPTVSNYLDNTRKVTVFEMMVLVSAIVTLLFLANFFIESPGLLLGVVFVLGCGLYSSLGNWLYLIFLGSYYFTKKAIIRFDIKSIDILELKEIVSIGMPGAVTQLGQVVRGFVLNYIFLVFVGDNGSLLL